MMNISQAQLFMNHYTRWLAESTEKMEKMGYCHKDGWSIHDNGQISRQCPQFKSTNRKQFAKETVVSWEESPLYVKL